MILQANNRNTALQNSLIKKYNKAKNHNSLVSSQKSYDLQDKTFKPIISILHN